METPLTWGTRHEMEQSRHVFILVLGSVLLAHDLSNCLPVGDASTHCQLRPSEFGLWGPTAHLHEQTWLSHGACSQQSQIPSPRTCSLQAPHLSLNPPPSSWLRFTISRLSIQRTWWDGSWTLLAFDLTLLIHMRCFCTVSREQGVRLWITWAKTQG